jgi:hypothetical protein
MEDNTMTTIRVVRRGEGYYTAEFSHTGHEHRAEGKTMEEAVGKLVREHPDLLETIVSVQDVATNKLAQAVQLQPSCLCE